MEKKPFPFKVCEQCCENSGTGGGGGLTPEELEKLNKDKIEFWKPNTEYKAGQSVISNFWHADFGLFITVAFECIKDHTSPDVSYINEVEDFNKYWGYLVMNSYQAVADANNNPIHETYATKGELGNIETALDNIIAIQNQLIGGGSV